MGPRARQCLLGAAAASAPVAYRLRKPLRLPAGATTAWLFAAPVALAAAVERSVARDGIAWAAQMWAYKNAFELPKDHGQRHRERTHVDYAITLDTLIGGGIPVGRRMQRAWRRRGSLTLLDKATTLFYLTWEAEPHLALAWIRRCRPDAFASAAGRLAATFDLTLIGYWIVPSAPPWWASEKRGRMGGDVHRVMVEVTRWLRGESHSPARDHEVGANVFAAMPSDHFASAVMTAMLLAEQDQALGAAGWAYGLLLGFALVYLGEHYVTDLVAGLVLALVVQRSRRTLERIAQAVLDSGPGSATG